jgi:hypothetical protein
LLIVLHKTFITGDKRKTAVVVTYRSTFIVCASFFITHNKLLWLSGTTNSSMVLFFRTPKGIMISSFRQRYTSGHTTQPTAKATLDKILKSFWNLLCILKNILLYLSLTQLPLKLAFIAYAVGHCLFLIYHWDQPFRPFLIINIFLPHLINHKFFLYNYPIEISQKNRNNHQ